MEVTEAAAVWPEDDRRVRCWVAPDRIGQFVQVPAMRELLREAQELLAVEISYGPQQYPADRPSGNTNHGSSQLDHSLALAFELRAARAGEAESAASNGRKPIKAAANSCPFLLVQF